MDKNDILISLVESDKIKFRKDYPFETLSVPQKVFCSVWAVEAEVNNGGFKQYFFNSSRETAGFVVQALEIIGAQRTAGICKRAIACAFPSGLPSDLKEIQLVAAGFWSEETRSRFPSLETSRIASKGEIEELSAYDSEFYTYPDNLTDLLFAYAAKHPEEFGELPEPG